MMGSSLDPRTFHDRTTASNEDGIDGEGVVEMIWLAIG